ncbi:MAG: aminomethyl-transferring glycine dehydrogenase subunit GcvPA [Calditrichaeota bacterium]|nr:aminomethyl-transferring glycine dehydrogenase subunit GcvPA [Calditrichota bacterium]MBT7789642.1 aminomethyl-transferring glycine dehydrogenase subunit GcvPA [Calditrichota bacterium]
MDFTSHTDTDIKKMLEKIGVDSIDEIIAQIIPERLKLNRDLELPDCAPETSLARELSEMAGQNKAAGSSLSFLGGGVYDHYTPAAVSNITSRSEFSTAYTPYQAEVSQGTLQTIYEFQTMVARLMGMDAANASHYDGATALTEGVLMAVRKSRKNSVVVPAGLNPAYLSVLETYCKPVGVEIRKLESADGLIDLDNLKAMVQDAGAVVLQQPNFFGLIEPVEEAAQIAHDAKAFVVSSTYPSSLALLKPPGQWGADVATAEGQAFGVPMSMGGPYLGLFAVKKAFIRQMPGRVVARTIDSQNRDGFCLTLQTREQHIRREKATSNICSNQALVALSALVYMSLTGRDGLRQVATDGYRRAHYLAGELQKIPGCKLRYSTEFFNEFVLELPVSAENVISQLAEKNILAGPPPGRWFEGMENSLLIAVTEKRIKTDLDEFVQTLKGLLL